jgi:putative nucleotidyltransferase with HDIG domain
MPKKPPSLKDEDLHIRENYSDHSQKFHDWAQRMGIERSPILHFFLRIDERFLLRRFALVFFFAMLLAIAMNFEIRTHVDYEVGDIAKEDIVSPVSFTMVDQFTTDERRGKASDSVPTVFDFDPLVFEQVSNHVYRSFRLMRVKLKQMPWPKSPSLRAETVKDFFIHKGEFDKEIGISVNDYTFEWLVENRFNARIENALLRNLDFWYRDKIIDGVAKNIQTKTQMVLARVVQKNNQGREFHIRKTDLVDLNEDDFFQLREVRGLSPTEQVSVLNLARTLVRPNLTVNVQETETRRAQARDSVLPVTVSVKRNQVLIQKGSVIQPYHDAWLDKIKSVESEGRYELVLVATTLLFLFIVLIFFSYLRRFTNGKVRIANRDLLVMGLISLGCVILTRLFLFFTEDSLVAKFGTWIPPTAFLFAAPVAAGPMLLGLLIQSGEVIWLFTAFVAISMGVMTDFNFPFMLVTMAGGIAAARGVYNCKKRNDIYWAGVRTGLVNAAVVTLIVLIQKADQPSVLGSELMWTVPAALLGGILASFVAMMVVPMLESIFNYTTDVKLLELSNLNHPLLKDMIVKAPGTYHHSMMVGSMVEAAAEEIGANPLLGKVMCYYHDIGKMEHSNYFIENQKPGHNPHDHISPYMSKTLLVAHVKDGVELGMEHKLGEPIIAGIIQHHGTTLISYFHNKAVERCVEGDKEVPEEEFRYPGPKPQFREAALCMLADSIEAAARSLDEPTPVRLQNIVRNIVQRKFLDGQLDECNMTLKDLSKVELAFTRILLGIYHQRIDYPRASGGGASEAPVTPMFKGPSGKHA